MENMQVYLGVWTNWSRGAVMGATLTTTREYGNLLIALTAFFIPYVATRFWRICCFFLHRFHSTAKPKGAIHHQRQVLLRNASSMESALITLLSLIKSWSSKKHAKIGALLSLLGYTILIIAAFTVAGAFSSRISSGMSDEVLVNGNHCGVCGFTSGPNIDSFAAVLRYFSETYTDALNYAQQCYSDDSSGILGCDRFVVKSLKPAKTETNRSCPFTGDICRNNDANIRLDTGYIDSHDHLGLNAPPNERFGYRYVLECAPLKTEGRVSHIDQGNVTWARYNYGSRIDGAVGNRTLSDYTYEVEDMDYQYNKDYDGPIKGDFLLSRATAQVEHGMLSPERGTFIPIPELIRSDRDTTLVFLSGNGVYFYEPLDDDWYRATTGGRKVTTATNTGSHLVYYPEEAASPLGCVQQWQWCKSNYQDERNCGPLGSALDSLYGASRLYNVSEDIWKGDANPSSNTSTGAQFVWPALIMSVGDLDLSLALVELKSAALASRSSSINGIQMAIPNNQWQLDVTNWWHTILAKTQAVTVNAAVGHSDPSLINSTLTPANQYEQDICNNQKVRNTDFASFSLFGIYFTYITGTLIIIISLILEPLFECLRKRMKYKQYEDLEWSTNATLQLHRLAHEELGSQEWSGCTDSVPTISPEENLVCLDIDDLDHPILTRLVKVEQEVAQVNEGNSVTTDQETDVESSATGKSTAVHVNEANEEAPKLEVTDYLGLGSPISMTGHGSLDPLQWANSTTQSLSSVHFSDLETRDNLNLTQDSSNINREELTG